MKAVILEKQAISVGDISFDKFHEKWDFTEYEATHPSQITERCIDADAVLCNKTLFTADVIASLPKLKYIGVCATGYNNIDIAAASERGITVTNVPAYSTDAVAQHVFAFILHLTNRVAVYNQSVHIGDWINSPNECYRAYENAADRQFRKICGSRHCFCGSGFPVSPLSSYRTDKKACE